MRRSVKSTKKALVTGASGLLGLEVVRCLSDSGFDVVGVYNSNPQLADKNYRNLKCDIGDLKSVNFLDKKIGDEVEIKTPRSVIGYKSKLCATKSISTLV